MTFLKKILSWWVAWVWFSLPVQLLLLNIKKNQLLLVLWLSLFLIVLAGVGDIIGVPSLFLEPEYLDKVDFRSFLLLGITLGVFAMCYHITCYIIDAPQFAFLGVLNHPFAKFIANNALIPISFMVAYSWALFVFQSQDKNNSSSDIFWRIAGLWVGYNLSSFLLYLYFINTNKDIIKIFTRPIERKLQKTHVARINIAARLHITRQQRIRIDSYVDGYFRPHLIPDDLNINSYRILKVFDQNHQNGVVIQLSILVGVLCLGLFRDYPVFQIPAAASLVLLFTIILMLLGAVSYWLRSWTFSFTLLIFLLINLLTYTKILHTEYEAYGLNYKVTKAEYSLKRIREMTNDSLYAHDYHETMIALDNWRKKFPTDLNPKMIFICTSGGGQRAALWTMRTMQYVDSLLNGNLMHHTMLITGASGGLIGAAYFRELYRLKMLGEPINIYHPQYFENLGRDNLNAIMFSLVVNDLFLGFQQFEYKGKKYNKDRGYALEEQINKHTNYLLDKSLCEYREYELLSIVPMLILSPVIMNDGRKLYISPLHVSYMTVPTIYQNRFLNQKVKGVEFLRFFEAQESRNLRFLTALRMNASFPYVTPNIELPSEPAMKIMDAGFADNFGVSDAIKFIYTFRKWIQKNTSGVIFVSIRDTQKDSPIEESISASTLQQFFSPLSSIIGNLEYLQDIKNDNEIEFAQSWLGVPIARVEFQYVPISQSYQEIKEKEKLIANNQKLPNEGKVLTIRRAPLSWRLTARDKESIFRTIFEFRNQVAIRYLGQILR